MDIQEILKTIVAAAAPIGELRFAIPLAVVSYDFTWYQAAFWGVLGNLMPVLILPWVLRRLGYVLFKFPQPVRGILKWRTDKLREGGTKWVNKYGRFALIPFVAIPLPLTGAWTGCLAAWTLDIHPKKAIPMLALGVVIAAAIVTTLTELGVSISVFLGKELE